MAGRPLAREKRNAGIIATFEDDAHLARKKIAHALPEIVDGLIEAAKGLWYEEETTDKEGKVVKRVYRKPPDARSAINLMDRVMGSARVESNPISDRLDTARAVYLEEQVMLGLIAAQKRELDARATKGEIEAELFPKQFVTEEEELSNLQAVAEAANKILLTMTPEQFETITKDKSPSEALESLKGLLGRKQADILADVMTYRATGRGEGDEEEEEEE